MLGALIYLLQMVFSLRTEILIAQGELVEAYDGVHRRPYLVAHPREERGFGHVRLLCGGKRFSEGFVPSHCLTHLLVDDGQS